MRRIRWSKAASPSAYHIDGSSVSAPDGPMMGIRSRGVNNAGARAIVDHVARAATAPMLLRLPVCDALAKTSLEPCMLFRALAAAAVLSLPSR